MASERLVVYVILAGIVAWLMFGPTRWAIWQARRTLSRNKPFSRIKYRKLRVAWSVACGVLCLLLIVLWVRSYQWADTFSFPITSKHLLGVGSAQGGMTAIKSEYVPGYYKSRWEFEHFPIADPSTAKLFRPHNRPGFYGVFDLGFIVSAPFFVICVPYWCLIGGAIAIGYAPWTQRFGSFSLRTLLIGMTVVAILLALILWASRGS
jgi:hypothetical protein